MLILLLSICDIKISVFNYIVLSLGVDLLYFDWLKNIYLFIHFKSILLFLFH